MCDFQSSAAKNLAGKPVQPDSSLRCSESAVRNGQLKLGFPNAFSVNQGGVGIPARSFAALRMTASLSFHAGEPQARDDSE